MKRILLPISLLAASIVQIYCADQKVPPIIEPLEDWAYESEDEDESFERFKNNFYPGSYLLLKNAAGEHIQVNTDTLMNVGDHTTEAFAFRENENKNDDIVQVRFNHKETEIEVRLPVRAKVNEWQFITHYKNIKDMNSSYQLMKNLVDAVAEYKAAESKPVAKNS